MDSPSAGCPALRAHDDAPGKVGPDEVVLNGDVLGVVKGEMVDLQGDAVVVGPDEAAFYDLMIQVFYKAV